MFLFWSFPFVFGQDIHWSQFNDNPIFQNPGNAGNFNGDYRITANYRNQWKSVTIPFSTLSFAGDMRARFDKNLGIGLLLFNDQVGDGKFRTTEVQFNAAYLLKLTSDSMHSIRPGINVGLNHRQVNPGLLIFDNQFNGISYDPGLGSGENLQNDRFTNFSFGFGAAYQYFVNERKKINASFGVFNFNRPNQGFYGSKVPRDMRFNFSAQAIHKLDIDWDILPTLQFSVQGKYRELILGGRAKYTLINRNGVYRALYGGLFYRNRDAGYLSAGLDYNNWFFGISYDINFSKLTPASNARGGIEFALRYIIFNLKPKRITHRVCPDYI